MTNPISESDLALIGALIDGELDPVQSQALRERLLREPELKAKYEEIKLLNKNMLEMAEDLSRLPHNESLEALLKDDIETTGSETEQNVIRPSRGFALAASVLFAITGAWLIFPFDSQNQQSTLAYEISQQLETLPSMQKHMTGSDTLLISGSFINNDGQYCREYFIQSNTQQQQQLACRVEGKWQLQQTRQWDPSQQQYQPASGENNPVRQYIQQHNKKGNLSLTEERTLLEQQWQVKPH